MNDEDNFYDTPLCVEVVLAINEEKNIAFPPSCSLFNSIVINHKCFLINKSILSIIEVRINRKIRVIYVKSCVSKLYWWGGGGCCTKVQPRSTKPLK